MFWIIIYFEHSEESKPDSDLDEPWIMTVKGINANAISNKPSVFTLEDKSFINRSQNNCESDVNLNHLKIMNPPQSSQKNEAQKSVVHLTDKKDDRYANESTIGVNKNEELSSKNLEKEYNRQLNEVYFNRFKLNQHFLK